MKGKMIGDVKFELSTMYICVIDDSNRVRNRVSDRVSIFFFCPA